jgi:hypothetical protein
MDKGKLGLEVQCELDQLRSVAEQAKRLLPEMIATLSKI